MERRSSSVDLRSGVGLRYVRRNRAGKFFGSSSRSIMPSRQSKHRSATLFHSATRCVVTKIVLPRSASKRSVSLKPFSPAGSRLRPGSSSSSTGASGKSRKAPARAVAAFRRKVRRAHCARSRASRLDRSIASQREGADAAQPRVKPHDFRARQPRMKTRSLRQIRYRALRCDSVAGRRRSELIARRCRCLGLNQSRQHFDGRAFTGAVRTDQQRDFARFARRSTCRAGFPCVRNSS